MSEIAKWFSKKSVFLTGATGFVGKCLMIKLLLDCPDIDTIYIVVRPKKDCCFEQRKNEFKSHVAFSHLKNVNPSAMDKIHIVEGDICKQNLGMSESDRKRITETVSVIIHSAADVRFDRPIVDAYKTNVNGSKNVLDFATDFKNLLVSVQFRFNLILKQKKNGRMNFNNIFTEFAGIRSCFNCFFSITRYWKTRRKILPISCDS